MPSTITAYTSFTALTNIKSAEVNANFSNHRGNVIPIHETNETAGTTGTYYVGTEDYTFLGAHLNNAFLSEYDTTTSAPTPGTGFRSIYSKQDDKLYSKDDAGTEQLIPFGDHGSLVSLTVTANYTALSTDALLLCDASTAAFTVTFPTASANTNMAIYLKKTDPNYGQDITIALSDSDLIDGVTTAALLFPQESLKAACDGVGWNIVSRHFPPKRTEEKYLAAHFKTTGEITDLTFSNLITDNWYRLTGQMWLALDAVASDGDVSVDVKHNSVVIGYIRFRISESADTSVDYMCYGFSFLFKAAASTVTFEAVSSNANAYVVGGVTGGSTYATLLEENSIATTTDF